MVEGRDGQAYYVPLGELSEVPGHEARLGSIVQVSAEKRQIGAPAAPPTGHAPSHHGVARFKVDCLSLADLDAQVQQNGVTWLDRQIASGAAVGERARIGATRFERQLAGAIKGRAEHLKSLSLGEEVDGQFRPRGRFLDALYSRELQDADLRLRSRYGDPVRLTEGQRLQGRIEAIETLPSGPHAVISMSGRYALIPANADVSRQIGRSVGLKIGRGRRLDAAGEGPLKNSIRVEFLDLTRTRKRGR